MHREDLERRLDAFVRDNRFTIAVTFPAVGALLLVASAWGYFPEPLAFHPGLLLFGIAVMRLPLIAGLLPLVSRREGVLLGGLALFTWVIEIVAVETGYPYGSFEYGVSLGPMIAGVPVALPLFFIPLVVNAYLLALVVWPDAIAGRYRLPLVVGLVLAIDLVLDPAAVAIGFWSFDVGGPFYGVPWSNFAGWLLSGTIAVVIVEFTFASDATARRICECEFILDDLVSFSLLWGTINLVMGNWVPVFVVLVFIGTLLAVGRLDLIAGRPSREFDWRTGG